MNLNTIKYKIRCTWNERVRRRQLEQLRKEIIRYYALHPTDNKEVSDAVTYTKNHQLHTFQAEFAEKYSRDNVEVIRDENNGLLYVMHDGKKLYFRRDYNRLTVQYLYSGLITEQDAESPHRYTDDVFKIEPNDVLFDIGSAEGIIALSHIEEIKHVVLFERDKEWGEALNATFAPWKEKVTIIPKYVSDKNDENNISIDTFLNTFEFKPTFVKIDVEGMEDIVLRGMTGLMKDVSLKIALCTYHRAGDFERFKTMFEERGDNVRVSKGVMLFMNDISKVKPPYFRKGLLRVTTHV